MASRPSPPLQGSEWIPVGCGHVLPYDPPVPGVPRDTLSTGPFTCLLRRLIRGLIFLLLRPFFGSLAQSFVPLFKQPYNPFENGFSPSLCVNVFFLTIIWSHVTVCLHFARTRFPQSPTCASVCSHALRHSFAPSLEIFCVRSVICSLMHLLPHLLLPEHVTHLPRLGSLPDLSVHLCFKMCASNMHRVFITHI